MREADEADAEDQTKVRAPFQTGVEEQTGQVQVGGGEGRGAAWSPETASCAESTDPNDELEFVSLFWACFFLCVSYDASCPSRRATGIGISW